MEERIFLNLEGEGIVAAIVKEASDKVARNGKPFVNICIEDVTGRREKMCIFKDTIDQISKRLGKMLVGSVFLFKLKKDGEYYNVLSISNVEEGYDESPFKKGLSVEQAGKEMNAVFKNARKFVKPADKPDLIDLAEDIFCEHEDDLKVWPGAKVIHHAYPGGLIEHTSDMVRMGVCALMAYQKKLDLNPELLMAGLILHDIGKLHEIYLKPDGEYDFTKEGSMYGHSILGERMVRDRGREMGIDEEKLDALCQVILSHHAKAEWGAACLPCCIEGHLVSHIDNMDAKMNILYAEVKPLAKGEFSGRIFACDNTRITDLM